MYINSASWRSTTEVKLYKVVRKTDEGNKQLVVATEENAQLFCQTNVPWKKCWWKPPRNGVRQVISPTKTYFKISFEWKGCRNKFFIMSTKFDENISDWRYDCTDYKNDFDFFLRLVKWPKIAVKKAKFFRNLRYKSCPILVLHKISKNKKWVPKLKF